MKKIIAFIILISILAGCSNSLNVKNSVQKERESVFYITPMIEGVSMCEEALNMEFNNISDAIDYCTNNNFGSASLITKKLNEFEPNGAQGKVQVGYQMGINLLGIYEKVGEEWVINDKALNNFINVIRNVNRPVVVYLMFNHFDTSGSLPYELALDEQNLMHLQNGEAPSDSYFGNSVIPYTISTDDSIPVNAYRFEALKYVANKLSNLPAEVKERIIGITLAGEIHHLYPDFTNGAAGNEDFLVTDYSPISISEFQTWLEEKYKTVETFNKQYEVEYSSFSEIEAPSKNIHKVSLNSYLEHYDEYAAGIMPIAGWLWDEKGKIDELHLYIDGKYENTIPKNLHRLDVYRAVEEITDPNVGYRIDYNYTELKAGHHLAQVIAVSNDKEYLLNETEFVVVDRNQGTLDPEITMLESHKFKNIDTLNIRYWQDTPNQLAALYYNPLAADWNEFRENQVYQFIKKSFDIVSEEGIDEKIIFSHQINSKINSTWQYQFFMEEKSLSKSRPYQLGVNLYGGATNSDAVREFLLNNEVEYYGVPEFHTQQWKNTDVAYDALVAQYEDGAKFISPYYISIYPENLQQGDGETLKNFNIRPDNELDGSNLLYQAIKKIAEQ